MRNGGEGMKYFPGIDDNEFIRGNIPMTKSEVRILTLAKARIAPQDIVLDIGAGTGSLSVEAALLAPAGRVYAVEREPEGVELIRKNAEKFQVPNLTVVHGTAPAALTGLPLCNVVLIGGSGGSLAEIIAASNVLLTPGGRLIITAVTVETLYQALQIMQQNTDYQVEAFAVQISRITKRASYNMLQALNPIQIISCSKKII